MLQSIRISRHCWTRAASTACWSRRPRRCICHWCAARRGRRADPVREALRDHGGQAREAAADRGASQREAAGRLLAALRARRCSACVSVSPTANLGALYFLACYQWDGEPPAAAFRVDSGGIFVDMGVHEFDQIRWLSGQEFARLDAAVADRVRAADHQRRRKRPGAVHAVGRQHGAGLARTTLPLGDVCRVEAFGTRDAEDCRFLWPPDGEAVFLDALATSG